MNYKQKKNFKKGFTIIELLVVVAIATMVLSFVFVFVQGIRAKSRDARREEDIKQLQTALNLYSVNRRQFPVCVSEAKIDSCLTPLVTDGSIAALPRDPLGGTTGICGDSASYVYCYISLDGLDYTLRYHLETDTIQGKSAVWQSAGP